MTANSPQTSPTIYTLLCRVPRQDRQEHASVRDYPGNGFDPSFFEAEDILFLIAPARQPGEGRSRNSGTANFTQKRRWPARSASRPKGFQPLGLSHHSPPSAEDICLALDFACTNQPGGHSPLEVIGSELAV